MKLFLLAFLTSFQAFAAVPAKEKELVLKAMRGYVDVHTERDGFMPLVHEGKILRLQVVKSKKYPDGFHTGVQKQGRLYAACADFKDPETGKVYDVDFLVNLSKKGYSVVQPIVHSIDGKKNPYDLAH